MCRHNSGFFGSYFFRMKKMFLMIALCAMLGFSASSQAIDLTNPNVCSSGITNLMSDMGIMAYQVADFLNSFCKAIPFFGMFCPDLDQIAGAFFAVLLSNPDLTLDMMVCADQNPSMLSFMLHIMGENPELLYQLAGYMGQTGDGTSKGCQLGDILTTMALRHNNLKSYLFAEMDDYVYANLAKNMQCQSDTTVQLSELIARNPQELEPGTPFDRTMRRIHTVESDADGTEVSTERMFQAIFNNVEAANFFLDAVEQLPGLEQQRILDFVFLGKTMVTDPTCNPNYSTCATTEVIHTNQAYLNMYALLSGFDSGVMSSYVFDPAAPPTPDSEFPANALFGRMAPMLMTPSFDQLSPYGISFFGAMLTGTYIYQWQPGMDVLADMGAIMEFGHLPFTMADLESMLDQLVNPNAPAPRNILDDTDCAADFAACLTAIDCDVMGGFWYDDICNALRPVQTAHFEGSLFYSERKDIGPFTVDNDGDFSVVLSGTGDIDLYVSRYGRAYEYDYDCKSDDPATSEESCILYGEGEYWISLQGDWDAQTTYTLDVSNDPNMNGPPDGTVYQGTGCAIDMPTCSTPTNCTEAGGYWYDNICNIIPPVQTADYEEQLSSGGSMDIGSFTVNNDGNFLVEMTGSGDVDLYIRKSTSGGTAGLKATTEDYDCKSAVAGTAVETCELFGEGVYWIFLKNNGADTANIELKVKNDPIYVEIAANLNIWDNRVTGYDDGMYLIEIFGEGFTDANIYEMTAHSYSGTMNWYDNASYGPFNADNGNFTATLSGTGDINLYVRKDWQPSPGSPANDCNSESSDSDERCHLSAAGDYLILVDADPYDNGGSYTLDVTYQKPSATVRIISDQHAILMTYVKPEGEIRVEDIYGRVVSMVIPSVVEPLSFNDADDDGLHDAIEILLGTNPQSSDSDGDGVSDFDEVNVDGDPMSYTPGVDTDPMFNDFDVDGDGINDDQDPLPDTFNYNDGDLAPLGAPDGLINAADLLIARRIQMGELIAAEVQLAHGDVYPPGAPDGVINTSDVILIQKMILGGE